MRSARNGNGFGGGDSGYSGNGGAPPGSSGDGEGSSDDGDLGGDGWGEAPGSFLDGNGP